SPVATAYDFQRKTFFEPTSGRYWAFYYNGSVVYRSSTDGVTWSAAQYVPGNWPGYWDSNYPYTYSPSVINVGRSVVVAYGSLNSPDPTFSSLLTFSAESPTAPNSGSTTRSGLVHLIVFSSQLTCIQVAANCMLVVRPYVNCALSPTVTLVLTFNWFYLVRFN